MFFEQRLIGSMANFGYVVGDPATKAAAVFDPSFDARVLQRVAEENGYSIGLIFNTHHHVDHVFDNERLANQSGGKIAAHRLSNVRKDRGLEDGQLADGVGLRPSRARRFLAGTCPRLPRSPLLRRAFHVPAADPGRSAPHYPVAERMAARVAPLIRRADEAAREKRIPVVARGRPRAAP